MLFRSIQDPELALQKYKPQPRFRKLHDRVRDRFKNLVVNATMPLQISYTNSTIKKEMSLNLSHTMVRKYLTQELNVSYRKLRPVSYLYNNLKSKLEKQLAASVYIDYLETERRIINIDESIITLTEH